MKAKVLSIIAITFVILTLLSGGAARETQKSYAYTNNTEQTFAGYSASYVSGRTWTTKVPIILHNRTATGALDGKVYAEVGQSSPKVQSLPLPADLCCKPFLLTSRTGAEIQDPLNDYVHVKTYLSFLEADVTTNTLHIIIHPEIIGNPNGFWWFLYVLRLSDLHVYDQLYGWWNGEWTQYISEVDTSIPGNADVIKVRLDKTDGDFTDLQIQVRGESLPTEKDIFFQFWIHRPDSTNWDYWIDILPKAFWRPEWSTGWYWEISDNDSHFPMPGPEEDLTQASITPTGNALEFAMTLASPNPQTSGFFQPAYWWALDTDHNGSVDVTLFSYWEPYLRKWEVFLIRYLLEEMSLERRTYESTVTYMNNNITVTVPLSVLQIQVSDALRWQAGTMMVFCQYVYEWPVVFFRSNSPIDMAPGEWIDLPTPKVDLWIEKIDVAQVVLADTKLACGKPTLIRVFARASGTQDVPAVVTVTVRDQNGNDLGATPIQPTSGVALARKPNEQKIDDSFNFLFSKPVSCSSSPITITINAYVQGRQSITDPDPINNQLEQTKVFEPAPSVNIGWLPVTINFPSENLSLEGQLNEQAQIFFESIYPGRATFRLMTPPTNVIITGTIKGQELDYNIDDAKREVKRVWHVLKGNTYEMPDRLFGALPTGTAQGVTGTSDPRWSFGEGRVAVGAGDVDTLAHELLHLLNSRGLKHVNWNLFDNNCAGGLLGWMSGWAFNRDYPNGSGHLDVAGIRITDKLEVLGTSTHYDVMTYCSPTWISQHNYEKLWSGFEEYGRSSTKQISANSSDAPLLVSGVVFSDTQRAVFDPIYPLGPLAQPDSDEGGDYCLEERTADGLTLDRQCFSLYFGNAELGVPGNEAHFIRRVLHVPGAVEIALTHGGEVLGRVRASNFAPTVRLLRPNGGEVWPAEGTYTISWEASDGDGDSLKFNLYYSPDDGASWSPVALDVEGNQYTANLSLYPGSERARFKVVASDGFLFAEDISDAPFRVIAKAPQVEIFSPQSGATLAPGYGALLEGAASDIEDGPIPDDRLTWSSDVDGFLGTGRWIVTTLSPGYHNITLTATDSDGNRGTATIRVYVGYKVYLPLVLRNYR